ncbi:hypothetical protein C8D76_103169 [Pasteurella langaaensis DSM 22999]|uniref:Porin n=1 Tax=Alitibacter langaaensis DSM 22999 TaxID=1122935 RepID=A0A2U0TAQ3_9PAST|nr:OmpG family monomeric porin [Pasteurella langaaensis]PVX40594.1 hypothetical protein C8D76_103169 [Pasteurella langaaensis DSM 22999]
MNKTVKYQLTAIGLLMSCIFSAQAAKVDSNISWENVHYGTAGDYAGPRIDTTISPDNSNWYFSLGWRQNRTKGQETEVYQSGTSGATETVTANVKDYQRLDFKIAYRYRLDKGWVQPAIGYRQDLSLFPNGKTGRSEYYLFEIMHNYPITERLSSTGWIKLQFNPNESITYTSKRSTSDFYPGTTNPRPANYRIVDRDESVTWEVEQGFRYAFSPKFNVTAALNDTGNRQEQDDLINSSVTKRDLQFRLYLTYNTDFGLQFSPYLRKTIFGDAKEWKLSNNDTATPVYLDKDTTRYAMRMSYPLNKNVSLTGEYYIERVKKTSHLSSDETKQKYLKLGLRVTF